MKTKWEEVGCCGVDAGMLWLGDPCYVFGKTRPKDIGEDWGEFCDILGEKEQKGCAQFRFDLGHAGLGVTVQTGYGDGCYPVLVRRDRNGRIAEMKIVFIEEERKEHERKERG